MIKKIRKELSLTQEAIAKVLDIAYRTYTAYERDENNPPYYMLDLLCKKYNVNLNWFISDKGNKFIENKPIVTNNELEQQVVEVMKKYGVIEK